MDWKIWVKKNVLALYENESKDLEIRLKSFGSVRIGDFFIINDKFRRRVVKIRSYPNFESMLMKEDCKRIYRGMSLENLLAALHSIYPQHRVQKSGGILVFELAN